MKPSQTHEKKEPSEQKIFAPRRPEITPQSFCQKKKNALKKSVTERKNFFLEKNFNISIKRSRLNKLPFKWSASSLSAGTEYQLKNLSS